MYQDFFDFNELPFSVTPNVRFFYLSARHKEALNYLLSGLGQGGGFALLTGEVGTGKTIVSHALFSQLDNNVHLALILNPTFSAQELLEAICDELKVIYTENASLKQLTDAIVCFLKTEQEKGFQTIVAIDEAQHLGPDVLEQLRLLTNYEMNNDKLLKVLLIGQPELQQKLQQTNLRQLAQRITARYHLLPLTPKEIMSYIEHRLTFAGGELAQFTPAALKTIIRHSNGIPRVVNLLCDKALWVSYQEGSLIVGRQAADHACGLVLNWQQDVSYNCPKKTFSWLTLSYAIIFSLSLTIASYHFLPKYLDSYYSTQQDQVPQLTGFSSPSSAFQQLLSVWGYSVHEFQSDCSNAKRAQLFCIEGDGALSDLLAMNRPAIVWLQRPNNSNLLAILYRVDAENVELLLPSQRVKVSRQWFNQHWSGSYTQLWKKPIMTDRAMRLGDQGEAVLILNHLLSLALNEPATGSDVFNKVTEKQVKQFQYFLGLDTDGIVGSNTQMWLDTIANVDAPFLQKVN